MLDADKLERYAFVDPQGKTTPIKPNDGGFLAAALETNAVGSYQVVASYKPHFFSVWEEDGKTRYESVPMTGLDNVRSSNYYEMYAKALLQVDAGDPKGFTEPVGDNLEMVPLVNPTSMHAEGMSPNAGIPVRVLFRGEPAAEVSVAATYMGFSTDGDYVHNLKTDEAGTVIVDITKPGVWMIHAFHATSLRESFSGQAQEAHHNATLTFEVPK